FWVDPAAAGLQVTSDGKPKILDVIDWYLSSNVRSNVLHGHRTLVLASIRSRDIDTSTVVKAPADGCIRGSSGASMPVNSSWKNPSGEWHVGCQLVYELFTNILNKKWDEKNQEAIAVAIKHLDEFDECKRAC
ncbi:hypothetical protein RJ641_033867, partial [Dillenia turbinata]